MPQLPYCVCADPVTGWFHFPPNGFAILFSAFPGLTAQTSIFCEHDSLIIVSSSYIVVVTCQSFGFGIKFRSREIEYNIKWLSFMKMLPPMFDLLKKSGNIHVLRCNESNCVTHVSLTEYHHS